MGLMVQIEWIKRDCLWSPDILSQASWIWKALLKLRSLAEQFLRCQVGNGRRASFWFDYWTPMGPLIKLFGHSGPSQLGIPLNSLVLEACSLIGWNLRPARSPEAEALQIHLCSVPLPSLTLAPESFFLGNWWSVPESIFGKGLLGKYPRPRYTANMD